MNFDKNFKRADGSVGIAASVRMGRRHTFHESLVTASLGNASMVYFCEKKNYAVETSLDRTHGQTSFAETDVRNASATLLFSVKPLWSALMSALVWLSTGSSVVASEASSVATAPRKVEQLYGEFCSGCHGPKLEGGRGPSLMGDAFVHGNDDESIATSIRTGFPDKGMPGWGSAFSAAEVRSLVVYLREQRDHYLFENMFKPVVPQSPTGAMASELYRFRLETVADGLQIPWSIAFLSKGRMLVTERPGRLRLVENGKLLAEPIKGTPITPVFLGEGGLLSVVPHPDYANNGWIYLAYGDAAKNAQGEDVAMLAIVRGRIRNGAWVDQQIIWRAPLQFYLAGSMDFGGRMAFDREGYLYFSHGERDVKINAQDLTLPNGKIHRIYDDGRIPADNPFVKDAGKYPSIWSYGHRNPQGLAFDSRTALLWESEHGPRGGDELNIIRTGRNYGWPVITYGIDYDGLPVSDKTAQEGMEQPVIHWTPSIAVSGIAFYKGNAFPKWQHNLFVASLRQQQLLRLVIDGDTISHRELVVKDIGRLRDVAVGPDGYLYLAVNGTYGATDHSGRVVRLIPAGAKGD